MIAASIAHLLCLSLLLLPGCSTQKPQDDAVTQAQTKSAPSDDFKDRLRRMVENQIRARGIENKAVLEAMMKVPRHRFVPANYIHLAYEDHPLPIGQDQTISQPYIVAYMTEAAEISKNEKVLEIGTGSGYQAAILGEMAKEIYTIEIIPELAERARQTLTELGYKNVYVKTGNGYEGWAEHAPYDGIVVTAAPDEVPKALLDQLAMNGKMVIPVGVTYQEMKIITRTSQGLSEKRTIPVRFVPMTGKPKK
ncbi:MAG: protein-L-isoaspartate(D-aspartate) O-methyltransferase [Acidobacteria bacterium]|nr:protein-L-isoaspartate(D-aspartate) O-methyltransferase [Acidobacteriota bacterium]